MTSKPGEPDTGWTFVFFCIFVLIMAVGFWHYFKLPILEAMRFLRLIEFWVISIFTDGHDSCIHWLHAVQYNDKNPTQDIITWSNQCFGYKYLQRVPQQDLMDYFTLSASGLGGLERMATYYIHYPLMVVFGFMVFYILYVSPRNKFKTAHTLESFIRTQAKTWPVISPIINFNPIRSSARTPGAIVPDKMPMFAEALSPEEWISFHRIPVTNGIADREAARRALLQQLGPRWNGIEGQPPHIRALFAAFALKGAQKRTESDDFLGEIAKCWTSKAGLSLTPEIEAEVRKIIKNPELGGKASKIASEHAYRTTAILGALKWGRSQGGVLAPAQFLWLRGTDRNLWYCLNNLGRRSFHAEGAGGIAHFMAEQNAKKALPIPRIDTAIITLNQYLAGSAMPIPPREGDEPHQ